MNDIKKWQEEFRDYVNGLCLPKDDHDGIMEYISEVPSAEPEQIVRDIATIIENEKDMRVILKNAEPEPSIPLSWFDEQIERLKGLDNAFATLTAMQISGMVKKWSDEQDE